jgi:hypothetical protein
MTVSPDAKGKIRLCPFPWPGFRVSSQVFRLGECGFCGKKIIDRKDVGPHEPPPACPECQKKYYAGKL